MLWIAYKLGDGIYDRINVTGLYLFRKDKGCGKTFIISCQISQPAYPGRLPMLQQIIRD